MSSAEGIFFLPVNVNTFAFFKKELHDVLRLWWCKTGSHKVTDSFPTFLLFWTAGYSTRGGLVIWINIDSHDDVIKWKYFRVTGPLWGKSTDHTSRFPSQRPVMRSFDVFFDLRLKEPLSKQSRRRRFETPLRSLWRRCNEVTVCCLTAPTHYKSLYEPTLTYH